MKIDKEQSPVLQEIPFLTNHQLQIISEEDTNKTDIPSSLKHTPRYHKETEHLVNPNLRLLHENEETFPKNTPLPRGPPSHIIAGKNDWYTMQDGKDDQTDNNNDNFR